MTRARWAWCAVLVLSMLAAPTEAGAAPFDPTGHDWEGYGDWMAFFPSGQDIDGSNTIDFAALRAEDTIILVHPEQRLDAESFASFLSAGGLLIVLDDFGSAVDLLARYDIRRIALPANPAEVLRGNPELAIAEPVGGHELVRGVERVVTNHATGLEQTALTPLLVVRGRDGTNATLSLVGVAGRGRLIVVADPSALMNSMLVYPGNARLARNLAAFASRPGGRVHLLSGHISETGRFAPPRDLGEEAGARASAAGRSTPRELGPEGPRWLALALGLCVVVWV